MKLFNDDPGDEVDEQNMSTRSYLNDADKRQMAKHITTFYPQVWPTLKRQEQWEDFVEKVRGSPYLCLRALTVFVHVSILDPTALTKPGQMPTSDSVRVNIFLAPESLQPAFTDDNPQVIDPLVNKYRSVDRSARRAQAIDRDESSPELPEVIQHMLGPKRGRKPGEGDNDEYRPYKRLK